MIKQWKVEREWQEPFLEALRARGASPQACDAALGEVDEACIRENATAKELFGNPVAYGKEIPVSEPMTAREAGLSRTRALLLAIAGLVGMFFALLGWTGMVTDATKVWGANPTIWFVLGLIIAVAAAVGDTVLGRHADFTQGRADAGSTLLNRLLPWIIVALTLLGMLVVKLTHG